MSLARPQRVAHPHRRVGRPIHRRTRSQRVCSFRSAGHENAPVQPRTENCRAEHIGVKTLSARHTKVILKITDLTARCRPLEHVLSLGVRPVDQSPEEQLPHYRPEDGVYGRTHGEHGQRRAHIAQVFHQLFRSRSIDYSCDECAEDSRRTIPEEFSQTELIHGVTVHTLLYGRPNVRRQPRASCVSAARLLGWKMGTVRRHGSQ